MCRTYPLEFSKESTILNGKVPSYQYILPENIYDYSLPENQCYCSSDADGCPLNGLYNVSKCAFGKYQSRRHFYVIEVYCINIYEKAHVISAFSTNDAT